MKMLVLGVAVLASACTPSDILSQQGASLRNTDYVQLGVDAQRKRDAEEQARQKQAAAHQGDIDKHAHTAQAHVDLFEYKPAVTEWKEAYRISQDPVFLLRIAESERAQGNCAEAGQMYQQYLEKRPDAPDKAQVQGRLSETQSCRDRSGSNVEGIRQHYQSGVTHYELSEYDAAIKDFKEAYRLSNDPAYLFNIAQAYRLLRKCTDAMQFYQRYSSAAGDIPNKDKVEARIEEMRACAK